MKYPTRDPDPSTRWWFPAQLVTTGVLATCPPDVVLGALVLSWERPNSPPLDTPHFPVSPARHPHLAALFGGSLKVAVAGYVLQAGGLPLDVWRRAALTGLPRQTVRFALRRLVALGLAAWDEPVPRLAAEGC